MPRPKSIRKAGRGAAAHASANKFQALQNWRCLDGRVRGAFKYYGASTGRWSGSGPQPQNFRRESENTAAKFAAVMSDDIEKVRALGPPIEIVGDIARVAICAPPGHHLLIRDFSSIESRILAWIADQLDKVEQWAEFDRSGDANHDPYVVIGRALGHPEAVARQFGKIADLAFGYQGGLGAYANFAPEDDTASDAQIQAYKQAWRDRHPQIVQFWYGIDRAAIMAVAQPGREVRYGRLSLQAEPRDDNVFLFIALPSGRHLAYPFCTLITNRFGRPAVQFMDNALITGAYGGMWTANIVSGIARDFLADAMTRLDAAGYPVVLHVHDEIVVEVADG
jgi:DNA polymerase bacteriophage-type